MVAPDGVTVVDEYAPSYPVQFEDSSYGLQQLGNTSSETLIETGAACSVLVPPNGNLGSTWQNVGFNDGTWIQGTTGVGYERSSGYDAAINTDIEGQIYNQQTSVYLRIPFSVTAVSEISDLELLLQYDDGFVAYLNGVEVARDRAPASLTWNSNASNDHPDGNALQFNPFDLRAFTNQFVEGDNVLAIHGLNRSSTSSDLLFRPRLIATRLSDPALGNAGYFLTPTPGAVNGTEQGLPASEVTISVPSRTFSSNFQVALSGAAVGQSIRYTLDKSEPTVSSCIQTHIISGKDTTGQPRFEQLLKTRPNLSKSKFQTAKTSHKNLLPRNLPGQLNSKRGRGMGQPCRKGLHIHIQPDSYHRESGVSLNQNSANLFAFNPDVIGPFHARRHAKRIKRFCNCQTRCQRKTRPQCRRFFRPDDQGKSQPLSRRASPRLTPPPTPRGLALGQDHAEIGSSLQRNFSGLVVRRAALSQKNDPLSPLHRKVMEGLPIPLIVTCHPKYPQIPKRDRAPPPNASQLRPK
ncbi:chitobiase/beta-hexosaminidase C-terminal domain-containing protein [Akkermansiaceae bacterium]|nr:chitobiase/beta-hexosaminidase C-terminal domain-containing protein [Akkermansiaceae bacterium]